MMTRDELEYADDVLYPGKFSPYARNIAAHDQAQREEIAQQAKRIQELEEWQKILIGARTDQETVTRMAATEYTKVAVQSWKEKCAQQAKEIEAHEKLSKMNGEELTKLKKENQALREALQFIAR